MRLGFYDNAERRARWQDILKDYDPAGYRVKIQYPINRPGTIIRQMSIGGEYLVATQPGAWFFIELDTPFDWTEYEQTVLRGDRTKAVAVFNQLMQLGCFDGNGNITRIPIQWPHLKALGIRKGQPLEYVEGDESGYGTKTTLGIAKDVYTNPKNDHTIVEFFLLEPLSAFRAPGPIEMDFIKPEFLSRYSLGLTVEGIYRDWNTVSHETIPPGRLSEDGEEYIFDHPVELDQVRNICKIIPNLTPEDRANCVIEGATFHIVPIDATTAAAAFRPMRVEHAGWVAPFVVTKRDLEDQVSGEAGGS